MVERVAKGSGICDDSFVMRENVVVTVRPHEGCFEKGDLVRIGEVEAVIEAVETNLRGGSGALAPIGLMLSGIDRDTARAANGTRIECFGGDA